MSDYDYYQQSIGSMALGAGCKTAIKTDNPDVIDDIL